MSSGRHPELPAARTHLPPPRRHRSLSDRRVELSWQVGSPVVGGAPIAILRANLLELAAEFHELAASVHDLRAEEHAQALLDAFGDVNSHELWRDLRRMAAAAERWNAQKERHAAGGWRRRSEAEGDLSE
jgi:hypothetical protein